MEMKKPVVKYGVVAILDALGASNYSEEQIQTFLNSRIEIIKIVQEKAKRFASLENSSFHTPNIFMFGDSIIVTLELEKEKGINPDIYGFIILMASFLFHSMQHKILFRGAFSINEYIEDVSSNTVMGKAVTDAASWYEKSDWMGLSCTPGTVNVLEHYCGTPPFEKDKRFLASYPVPMKNGEQLNLYVVSWPYYFFSKDQLIKNGKSNSKGWFVELLKDFYIPLGAEKKYENTKKYFLARAEVELRNPEE